MRTLSKGCRYALRAMLRLCRQPPGEPLSISVLAEEEKLSRKFLEALLVQLRNQRLVTAQQGKNGGYTLARPALRITIGQIVRAIDGPIAPLPCLAREGEKVLCPECAGDIVCQTRRVIAEAMEAGNRVLDQFTLAELDRRRRDEESAALHFEI